MGIKEANLQDSIKDMILASTRVNYGDIFGDSVDQDDWSLGYLKSRIDTMAKDAITEAVAPLVGVLEHADPPSSDESPPAVEVTASDAEEEPPKRKSPKRKSPELIARVVELGITNEVDPKEIPDIINTEFPDEHVSYSSVTRIIAKERELREFKESNEIESQSAVENAVDYPTVANPATPASSDTDSSVYEDEQATQDIDHPEPPPSDPPETEKPDESLTPLPEVPTVESDTGDSDYAVRHGDDRQIGLDEAIEAATKRQAEETKQVPFTPF